MSYIFHTVPFKEGQSGRHTGLVQFGFILLSSLVLLILFIPMAAAAQSSSCGDIITEYDGQDERTPIENCSDPFGEGESSVVEEFLYSINGTVLAEGETREVESVPTTVNLESELLNEPTDNSFVLYRHEGSDYRQVDVQYQTGPGPVDLIVMATGTYSIVTSINPVMVVSFETPAWRSWLREFFIPTAHAQYGINLVRSVLTFTVTVPEPVPEPTGASSVLFVPGIMGSRLYEEGDFCDGENTEKELWFSTDECLQLRLTTKFTGQSDNPVYTKGNEEGILDDAFIFANIYESFLEDLSEWKSEDLINNYAVFPYDWRLELDAILKSGYDSESGRIISNSEESIQDGLLYKLITFLARDSKSGKVTIVTHSNGGLVIKQLLSNLQNTNDPLLAKIDVVILVAVPQLGSPGSMIGMLHGEEIDFVMSQGVTRRLMNTMPFAHHLLPTSKYFDLVDTPVIKLEQGTVTSQMSNEFGGEINSTSGMYNFLSMESGRVTPEISDLATPETIDPFLLEYAETVELVQNNFTPSPGMKIYQVAGTGLKTPVGLTYFTDSECVSRTLFTCTEYQPKLGYRISEVVDGDVTVPVPSALAMSEDEQIERRWIDLRTYNRDSIINRKHSDLFEVSELPKLIKDLLRGINDTPYVYVSNSAPVLSEGDRLIFQLHSPLDLSILTDSGERVSSTTNDIPEAIYLRYGELQYISIPRSKSGTVLLQGKSTGSFTLDVEGGTGHQTYSAIPSSTSTQVLIKIGPDVQIDSLILEVDYNGDGDIDLQYDDSGVIQEEVTYEDLFTVINESSLKRVPKTVLLTLAKTAERLSIKAEKNSKLANLEQGALQLLIKQSILYLKLGLLTDIEQVEIKSIATQLIKN